MTEHEFITTEIGQVDVELGEGRIAVRFFGNSPERLRSHLGSEGGVPTLTLWEGKRPPRIGDEVTQNGRTFEVTGTRVIEGGVIQLLPDNGTWETWVED